MVSCKKNLLLRFDNFEEGAELTYDRFKCFLFCRYFDSVRSRFCECCFSRIQGSFQMNCLFSGMILLMAHKSLVDWQQLQLFFPILKQRVHLILREWENSHLQSRTSQLGSYTCCGSHRNVRVLNLFACPCLVHDVQICSSGGKDPIVVVKREEGSKNKATRRTNQ